MEKVDIEEIRKEWIRVQGQVWAVDLHGSSRHVANVLHTFHLKMDAANSRFMVSNGVPYQPIIMVSFDFGSMPDPIRGIGTYMANEMIRILNVTAPDEDYPHLYAAVIFESDLIEEPSKIVACVPFPVEK